MSPYESFRCADREIVIAVTNQKAWTTLTDLPEFAALGKDERFTTPPLRSENRDALVPAVEAVMMTRPAAYWLETFDRVGIPSEPINTLTEMMEHPQVAHRGMLQEIEYPPKLRQPHQDRRHAVATGRGEAVPQPAGSWASTPMRFWPSSPS